MVGVKTAIVSTYPPRSCGIGTFSRDLRHALLQAPPIDDVGIVSIVREDAERAPEVIHLIRQDVRGDYAAAARALWQGGADVVVLQHEYGIFGGTNGAYVLSLAEELGQPFVVTLHTILSMPSPSQAAILRALAEKATLVTVFTETARSMMIEAALIDEAKIRVVPHGGPERLASRPPANVKRRLGLPWGSNWLVSDHDADSLTVLATFGLIGSGKGIEVAIEAMATIVQKHPNTVYVIAGRTHPEVARHDGERYRLSLERLARRLNISDHVHFDDRFLNMDDLATLLAATDIYVTPYASKEQIVSGSLTFALTAGCPVVSTPYFYATDMLASGAGVLVPFGDADAMAAAVIGLLDDPTCLENAKREAEAIGKELVWPTVGLRMAEVLQEAVEIGARAERVAAKAKASEPLAVLLPQICLDHFFTLVDDVGIIQHAEGSVPSRRTGYCVDDSARLAIVAEGLRRTTGQAKFARILTESIGFLQYAADEPGVGMRNFMSYDRRWLDEPHFGDHVGRAVWGLGEVIAGCRQISIAEPATRLFELLLPSLERCEHLHSIAYGLLGVARASELLGDKVDDLQRRLARRLLDGHREHSTEKWQWFEPWLTYDSARLSQSLVAAGRALNDQEMMDIGIMSLEWFAGECGVGGDYVRLIGNDWRDKDDPTFNAGDEQPLDAAALVEAEVDVFLVTNDRAHANHALQAFDWFLGRNHYGVPVYDFSTGGCHDGVGPDGLNANEGAESTLAFLSSLLVLDAAGLRATVPVL